jgi:predicted nucleic acid-binding protein
LKVLVDTPIWSYALRSKKTAFEAHVEALETLILEKRVLMIGAIRQEVLSGYSDLKRFEILKQKLSIFENTPIVDDDYIQGAKFSNLCRQNGIQGSHIDFLICAVAVRLNVEIFTTDHDFDFYQQHLPIKLHPPGRWPGLMRIAPSGLTKIPSQRQRRDSIGAWGNAPGGGGLRKGFRQPLASA